MDINIYCDESRHTSDPSQPYMVIGAISVPRSDKAEIAAAIHLLRKKYNVFGEFGWKSLSPNKRDFYFELISLFLRDDRIRFRCIVVDRNALDHGQYNNSVPELGFYKLYYQMLVHWLSRGNRYHIYLDFHQNKLQTRLTDLRQVLQIRLSTEADIACLEPESSKGQVLIQLTDLLIGAVGYKWNDLSASGVKVEFCDALAEGLGLKTLKISTGPSASKFNLFHFTGRR